MTKKREKFVKSHRLANNRKFSKRLLSVISVILVISLFSQIIIGAATENESESENNYFESLQSDSEMVISSEGKSTASGSYRTKVSFLFAFVRNEPKFFSSIRDFYFYETEVEVVSSDGWFSKIRIDKDTFAYILSPLLYSESKPFKSLIAHTDFYYLASKDTEKCNNYVSLGNLFSGDNLTYRIISGSDVIEIESGTVKACAPGIGVIEAVQGVNNIARCTIYVFYPWKNIYSSNGSTSDYSWSSKTNKTTNVYWDAGKNSIRDSNIPSGSSVEVRGDDGGSASMAHIIYNNHHGYVKMQDISTKNTESYYKSLGWRWPIRDTNICHISSPYAPRNDSTTDSIMHRGADIINAGGGTSGKYAVAPCSGTVKGIRYNTDSCGYCISISTDFTDSVTNQKMAVIYMHLLQAPCNEKGNIISKYDTISKNEVIGFIGNTNGGTSSMGTHLHFEVNNKNAGVGDAGRKNFVNTINPLYFYLDSSIGITYNFSASSADGYGFYWYNY